MKDKYEVKRVYDIIGTLDKKDDKTIIIIDGEEFDFNDIMKNCLGTKVHFKSEEKED